MDRKVMNDIGDRLFPLSNDVGEGRQLCRLAVQGL